MLPPHTSSLLETASLLLLKVASAMRSTTRLCWWDHCSTTAASSSLMLISTTLPLESVTSRRARSRSVLLSIPAAAISPSSLLRLSIMSTQWLSWRRMLSEAMFHCKYILRGSRRAWLLSSGVIGTERSSTSATTPTRDTGKSLFTSSFTLGLKPDRTSRARSCWYATIEKETATIDSNCIPILNVCAWQHFLGG